MLTINEAEEILKKEYHVDNFTYLVSDVLLPDFNMDKHDVVFSNSLFESVMQLGFSYKCELTVFEVVLKAGMQNKRVGITQEMFRVLRKQGICNAIVAFANADKRNYRISLLTSKYELDEDKIVKVLSNPRRYSYSLGYGTKTKTAYKFLIEKGKVANLDELISRFSVEVVNKQFYTEIATAFTELVGGERNGRMYEKLMNIYGVTDQNKYAEFGVRLIGRIMFCWFLREKKSESGSSLVPSDMLTLDGIGDKNYYHSVLEVLFFELLNTNQKRRKREFQTDYYAQVPYLNGGLFSPHEDDHYSYNTALQCGTYGIVTIPNEWFARLYSVLGEYNFTVDENTAYDIELSIDPEMLGRIFENLLAEINPETGENAKKSTGSFYTPRDIVDYMVDSSLCEYFKTKTGISEEKLRALISYSKEDDELAVFDPSEKKKLINALYTITVLDPACGSGAFPIGMLQKVVYMLQELDPDAGLWFDKATENAPLLLKREFEKKFNAGSLNYIRKLCVIQNSIFGIDIQPIAVEISRLRCFLSLIIEEKVDDSEENRGINPLPNLDFKFIIANSLMKLPDESTTNKTASADQLSLFENQDHISQLKAVREAYFGANDAEEKAELKLEFANIQKRMFQETVDKYSKMPSARYRALSDWSPFENKATSWFDPEWMFGVKGGFDIVIGNPPYFVYQASHKGEINELRSNKEMRSAFGGKLNAYKLFLAKALHSLVKCNGKVCFIFQNSFLADKQAAELRKDIFQNYRLVQIDSYPERDNVRKRVFESVKMSVCIALFSKESSKLPFTVNIWDDKNKNSGITTIFTVEDIILLDPVSLAIPRIKQEFLPIVLKMNSNIDRIQQKCYEGELNMTFHKSFFTKDMRLPKILKGASIQRYFWTEKMSQGEIEYLNETDYLAHFSGSEKSSHHKFPRIAMQGMTGANDKRRIVSSIVPEGVYLANSCNYILPNAHNLMYVLGVFNSKLINWYFRCFSTNSNVNGYEVDNLPICRGSKSQIASISDLVEKILSQKAINNKTDTQFLENEIDRIVYQIYGLTDDEIALVEESIK